MAPRITWTVDADRVHRATLLDGRRLWAWRSEPGCWRYGLTHPGILGDVPNDFTCHTSAQARADALAMVGLLRATCRPIRAMRAGTMRDVYSVHPVTGDGAHQHNVRPTQFGPAVPAAEARIGAELKAAQERGEVAKAGNPEFANVRATDNSPATLPNLGIPRQRAHEMKKLADAGEPRIVAAHQVVAYRAAGLTQHRRAVVEAVHALRAALAARHRADVRFAQEDLDDALEWLRTGCRCLALVRAGGERPHLGEAGQVHGGGLLHT